MDDDADGYGALAVMRSMGVVVVFDEHEIAETQMWKVLQRRVID